MATVTNKPENIVRKDKSGVLRVGKTRVSLDSVVFAFNDGASAEEIVLRYPSIDLMQVYSAISYYLQNTAKIDSYLARRQENRAALQSDLESKFSPSGIRQKLLSRSKKNK